MTSPSPRRVGVMLPRDLPLDELTEFARRSERLGFDEVWVVEDLGFRGGIAQAAVVLAATSEITVGIGILPAGARNVVFAAMEITTLARLFPGRLTVGIGHGMPDWMAQAGAWPKSPLTLLKEYTVALRALLRGDDPPAGGRYVDVSGVRLEERPTELPPVVLGVRGPRSLAAAGAVSDGVVLAEPSAPGYIVDSLRRVTAERTAQTDPLVITYDVAAVADDPSVAFDRVRPGLAWIGEPDWRVHIAPLDFADELAALRAECTSPAEFGTRLPDAWVAELALAGTPGQVRTRIASRHEAGATTVVLAPVGADRLGALDDLARVLR
ncbi:LLM class flavin-dependent oxidoreductase [Microbacterium stercoris]|uniref:LLM class flavin-dependent oxidoreductase n=1 Tax=Microbacterium stercoris TaxID=2820289 RepID=A0A939QLH7_9MICO|nr:LLM class flavin-dependent oxidoreductase [Microbacterium stercoris]MBO3663897.1 LLM class flavin-dependent oxidoreductase [Microbacterium stercoris]